MNESADLSEPAVGSVGFETDTNICICELKTSMTELQRILLQYNEFNHT